MSVEQFEHIAKQIEPYTDYVYLHVKGEPLLHQNLGAILEVCKKHKLKVNISTNGTLLKEKWDILKDIRQLNVSLHSFENDKQQELQEYLRGVIDSAEKLNNLGVIIRYKLWNDNENSINNNDIIIKVLEQKYNKVIQNTSYEKDIKLKDNIFLSIKQPFNWPDLQSQNVVEGPCYGLRQQIAILVDGTVVPCCVDNNGDIALGNIFDTPLDEILRLPKAQKIIQDFQNNKCSHELCKKCEYRISVT